jgi:hypothetical protein
MAACLIARASAAVSKIKNEFPFRSGDTIPTGRYRTRAGVGNLASHKGNPLTSRVFQRSAIVATSVRGNIQAIVNGEGGGKRDGMIDESLRLSRADGTCTYIEAPHEGDVRHLCWKITGSTTC